jgi:hypothetical protein
MDLLNFVPDVSRHLAEAERYWRLRVLCRRFWRRQFSRPLDNVEGFRSELHFFSTF